MLALSVLIPHRHTDVNDKALAIALSCLATNTRADFEILVDAETPADPYLVLNGMAQRARGEYLFFSNSDIFVSPGWDVDLMARANPDVMVATTLVECGAIGVYEGNIERNFGKTPDAFDRQAFEDYCQSGIEPPSGDPFCYYLLINRDRFNERGGFDTSKGAWPTPLDRIFWNSWLHDGLTVVRANSFVYHLQNFSAGGAHHHEPRE